MPFAPSRSRARWSTPRTSSTRAETAESSSNSAPVVSATIRASVVLPTPGRPVEDHRRRPVALDRETEGRSLGEHVPLTDELVERPGADALGERCRLALAGRRGVGEEVGHRVSVGRAEPRHRPTHAPPERAVWGKRSMLCDMSEETWEPPLSQPVLAGRGAHRLRALPQQRGAAVVAEEPRRVGAPGRAALPGRAPIVGAVAQAGLERHRRRGGARRRGRPRRGAATAPPREHVHALHHEPARHARADVALGVPGDPQGSRPRLGLRLARASRRCDPRWRGSASRSTRRASAPASRSSSSTSTVAITSSSTSSPRRMMELDEWMQTWRIRHYRVVARVIGEHVIGTQGTPSRCSDGSSIGSSTRSSGTFATS